MHTQVSSAGIQQLEIDLPGPKITAFQIIKLSAHGAPEMPPGGSVDSRLKSRISLRFDGVDWQGPVV